MEQQDSNSYYNNINKKYTNLFEYHFYIDFISKYSYNIDESYGAYKGQIEFVVALAEYISNELKNKTSIGLDIDKEDLDKSTDFENIFFKKIHISYEENIVTGYNAKKSTFDKKENLFDVVNISIDTTQYKTYNKLLNVLIHELTHAWEAYQRELNNNTSLYEITKYNSKYNNIIKQNDSDDDYDILVKQIEYHLAKFEINAFLSELNVELEKTKETINDYNDALKIFMENATWKRYFVLYSTFNSYDEDELIEFTEHYNKICNTHFTTNKLIKKITNRFEKVLHKILTNAPKIYFDFFNRQTNENYLIELDNSFIDFVNKMKTYTKPNWIK